MKRTLAQMSRNNILTDDDDEEEEEFKNELQETIQRYLKRAQEKTAKKVQ